MSRIVIAGGSGFIGSALAEALKPSHEVVIVGRSAGSTSWDRMPEAVDGSTAVINLAGSSIQVPWTASNRKLMIESRVAACEKVAASIRTAKLPPSIWINASATGYYGDRADEVLTEASSAGQGFLAQTCISWENASQGNPLPNTVQSCIRIGIVLGREGGAYPKLALLTRYFAGSALGSGEQWYPWIHLDDLVGIFLFQLEAKLEGAINGTTPNPTRNADLMRAMRHQMHRPWVPNVPAFVLRASGAIIGPDAEAILSSQRALPARMIEHGFAYQFPMIEDALLDLSVARRT